MVGETLVIQCAGCHAIKQPNGLYFNVPGITYKLPLASHGYCPACAKTIRDDFEKYKQLKKEKLCPPKPQQFATQPQ